MICSTSLGRNEGKPSAETLKRRGLLRQLEVGAVLAVSAVSVILSWAVRVGKVGLGTLLLKRLQSTVLGDVTNLYT